MKAIRLKTPEELLLQEELLKEKGLKVTREMYDLYKRTGIWPFPIILGELSIDGESSVQYRMSEEDKALVDNQLKKYEQYDLYNGKLL